MWPRIEGDYGVSKMLEGVNRKPLVEVESNPIGNQIEGTECNESRGLTAPSNLQNRRRVLGSYQARGGLDFSCC